MEIELDDVIVNWAESWLADGYLKFNYDVFIQSSELDNRCRENCFFVSWGKRWGTSSTCDTQMSSIVYMGTHRLEIGHRKLTKFSKKVAQVRQKIVKLFPVHVRCVRPPNEPNGSRDLRSRSFLKLIVGQSGYLSICNSASDYTASHCATPLAHGVFRIQGNQFAIIWFLWGTSKCHVKDRLERFFLTNTWRMTLS